MTHSVKTCLRRLCLFILCVLISAGCQLGPVPRGPERPGQKPGSDQQHGGQGQPAPGGPGSMALPQPGQKPSPEDRVREFAARGFGFEYRDDERSSMGLFIRRHGRPLSRSESQVVNRFDGITDIETRLRYREFEVRFLNYSPRTKWKAPESMLEAIYSVDGAAYLYGVKEGMPRAELVKLFNLYDKGGVALEISNESGNYATFIVDKGRLESIVWEYGRQ